MSVPRSPLVLALSAALLLTACGSGSTRAEYEPFSFSYPSRPDDGQPPPTPTTPPPAPPQTPVFDGDAYLHDRTVLYGGFPCDLVRHGDTLFTNDGDQIEHDGALLLPVDVSGSVPTASSRYVPLELRASDLRDSDGNPGDPTQPVGFGFFLNDIEVARNDLAFVLVNAGGSDSPSLLSNLVVFDPTAGTILQVVDLANTYTSPGILQDSSGSPAPLGGYVQSGAEALAYVPAGSAGGRLYVAMTNLLFLPPSSGTVKYPGTVQIFDVVAEDSVPVRPVADSTHTTQTFLTGGFNPVALQRITADGVAGFPGAERLLVTVAGTTAYDANFQLVPVTDASVAVHHPGSGASLGRFLLGPAGLAATRPALGLDAAGHHVAFLPSAVTGEVYLLLLDGLFTPTVDATQLAVLRGPENGIPVFPESAGGPGGNITSVGLSPDGRTLVIAGFGDLFAFPSAIPGKLYLLGLPADVVTGSGFGADFVPGASLYGTVSGRALGALALVPNAGSRPDVYVTISSPLDTTTFLASGPASLGSLQTFGLIR